MEDKVNDEIGFQQMVDEETAKTQPTADVPNVLFVGAHRNRGGGYSDLECRVRNLDVSTVGLVLIDPSADVRAAASDLVENPISVSTGVGSESALTRVRRTLQALYRLWEVVSSHDVDAISTNGYKAALLASLIVPLTSAELVARVHAKRFYCSYPVTSRFITYVSHTVLHVSEYTATYAWPWERSVIVRSPINSADPHRTGDGASVRAEFNATDAPVIGLIGRVEQVKGHEYLLDIIPDLKERYEGLKVLIVGDIDSADPEYVKRIKKTVNRNGLKETVVFTGFRGDIPDILDALDVLLVTSEEENVPKVIQEAFLAETPVVAHDVGGVNELVSANTGWLVPLGDRTALLDAVHSVLSKPQVAAQKAARGKELVMEKHGLSHVTNREEQVYRRLKEGKR